MLSRIIFADPPPEAEHILKEGLVADQELMDRRGLGGSRGRGRQRMKKPLPVYLCTLSDAAKGRVVEGARLSGWQYLIVEGDEIVEVAKLFGDSEEERLRFGGVARGGVLLRNIQAALHHAERLVEKGNARYELRLLDVPAVYVSAIWLKNRMGGEDRFLPLGSRGMPREPMDPPELTELVRHAALKREAFDDRPATSERTSR
jgi:hypothetical protein